MNEQTIEEIMNLVEHYADCDTHASHEFADDDDRKERKEARADLSTTITAALAAKDAEIERLSRECIDLREDYANLKDAMHDDGVAYRAEIERLTAQLAEQAKPEPGEWIEWKGGECPIADGIRHWARTRNDQLLSGTHATGWDWSHCGTDGDIIAYRVLP